MRKIFVFTPLLAAAILLTAGSVLAQEQAREIATTEPAAIALPAQPCPAPINMTLTATTPNVFNGDFAAAQLANQVGLNYSGSDKHFLHTFQWRPQHRCCQITKAVLTVRMKANQGGQSASSADAGNDGIAVIHLGAVVPPYNERVYSNWPFSAGQPASKTWNLTGAALANINANNRLSIYVQDDTMVQSATLQLNGCCLTN
ncbi:MAG TPA: hypothetical protein VGG03_07875 [Thermoanaerobaculia bacterium]|jgi:hypothetical protein